MPKGSIAPVLDYLTELRCRYDAAAENLLAADDDGLPERFRTMLEGVLPQDRYAIAKGRVLSAHAKIPATEPFAVLIHDGRINSAITRMAPPDLLPIETVYAAITYVPLLDAESIRPALADIGALRRMAKRGKHYAAYVPIEKPNRKTLYALREMRTEAEPRTYLVCRDAETERPDQLARMLKDVIADEDHARLHGLIVLSRNWFFSQPAYKKKVEYGGDSALLRFCHKLAVDLDGFEMQPLAIERYFQLLE